MDLVFFGSVAAAVCHVAFRSPARLVRVLESHAALETASVVVWVVIVLVGGAVLRALLTRGACCTLSGGSAEDD